MTPLEAATREAFPNYPPPRPKKPKTPWAGTRRPKGSGRQKIIDRETVRELTNQGQTAEQIAATLGCSTSSINQIRKQLGVTHPRMLTPEKRAAIEEALRDGWSHAEISRTLGTTHETIERHFPGSAWTHEQRAEHIRTLRLARTDHWGALRRAA